MATLAGTDVEVTEEGFLVNLNDWNEEVGTALAQADGIELTEQHWDIIKYLRDENVNGEEPNERTIVKAMSKIWGKTTSKVCYQLFPGAPSKQGRKYAGLPKSNRKGGY